MIRMIVTASLLAALVVPASAQQPQPQPTLSDTLYMMMRDREAMLQKQIEDLKARCGDRCTQPPPPSPLAADGGEKKSTTQ